MKQRLEIEIEPQDEIFCGNCRQQHGLYCYAFGKNREDGSKKRAIYFRGKRLKECIAAAKESA